MFVFVPLVSAIVLAMTPAARQVVQAGPSGPIAVSKSGYVAVVDSSNAVHFFHLPSRTLVRSIASATLNEGDGLVHPVIPRWDDATQELLMPRGNDILGVSVDGKLTPRAHQTSRLWPVNGGGKARWITRNYGDAEVRDATYGSLGKLVDGESIVAAGDGKSALVAGKDGQLHRFTLDPVAKHSTIKLPAPPDQSLSGAPLALSADGTTAVLCLKMPKEHQAVLVRGLDKQATITPIKFDGGMNGCDVALAELHGIVVVADAGEIRGFDLATGALRWQAPRQYDLSTATGSEIAIHGRTVLVSWRGLVMLDLVRGDVIGQIGTDVARPQQLAFLRGDQLLTVRQQPFSMWGPTGVALATWSLKSGIRSDTGSAMWGFYSQVAEDGTLITARPSNDRNVPCWYFSKGTTADGAPLSKDPAKGVWPPTPGKSTATCMPKQAAVMGAALATGAIVVNDDKYNNVVIPVKGDPVTLKNAPRAAMELAFSPDGKWVMGANMFGGWASLNVWDVKTGTHRPFSSNAKDPEGITIGPGPQRKGYYAHALSADSQQILVGGSDMVTLYALASKQVARTFTVPGPGFVTSVALAQGALLAGTSDGRLAVSRGQVVVATSDGGAIRKIVVRADGKRAATVSDDGAVRIWDLAKPALLATLVEASDGESFASTPGGAYVGGREAAEQLGWVFDGPTEGFKFERFAGLLARPDIVAKRLADATTDLAAAIVRPPRVTLTKQPPPTGNVVKLGMRVDASAGKVGSLRIFVNGRPAVSTAIDATGKDLTLDVPLEAGSNVVTLVAFDDAGRSSNPLSVDIGTPPATTRPDVWVIAAGVGWYPNLPVADQLEGSVNDAYAIADAFKSQSGPGKRYDNAHVTVLEDEQVTAEALDKALAQLAQMKATDVAVVFLAGHGVRLPKTEDMVLLTGTAKLDKTTWASSGIGWTKIGAALAKAKGRVIVLLDACHAGAVTQEQIVPNTQLADDLVSSQRAGVLVFAASKGSQKSLEENAARSITLDEDQKVLVKHKRVPKKPPPPPPPPTPATPTAPRERRGNGYFTGAVVTALDSPITDINRDGVVQTAELVTQVQLRVIRASRGKQTPWVARRELFGDFSLATAAK